MDACTWLSLLRQFRVIAVIRISEFELGLPIAKAIVAGGIQLLEVTWNSDRPADLIRQLRQAFPEAYVGAGTLLNQQDIDDAIAAGAQFLFTPHINPHLIRAAIEQDVPLVAGALTPTEIVTAWQAGATAVKVFPSQAVGGADYIRSLQGPLSQIPLIPTGGITLTNTQAFLEAGAIAVGLSGDLFPKQAILKHNWQLVTDRAATLVNQLRMNPPASSSLIR